MPSLDRQFLSELRDDYTKYYNFIETGTHKGDTIFAMEPYFNKLYTIEFSEKYYRNTKSMYAGTKIEFIQGDSSIVFNSLLPTITDKCIFFLDGHYSYGDTGQSEKDCPLIEEITSIYTLFQNEAIIIIDDHRLLGLDDNGKSKFPGWGHITKDILLNILDSRVNNSYFLDSTCAKNDRLIIHINAI
jgi:hypothetical protein